MSEEPRQSNTLPLLQRWHDGDRGALEQLIERDLPWIRTFVERRLGELLRKKGDVDDYVHDALIQVLEYVPRFLIADRRQFRALLGRICENTIRDRVEQHRSLKRDVGREREIPRDSVLALDPTARQVTHVSVAVDRGADEHWLRLAVELLDPPSRHLILMRDWQQMAFSQIAAALDVSEDAARMRYNRILPSLALRVEELRSGNIAHALEFAIDDEDFESSPAAASSAAPPLDLTAKEPDGDCWSLLDRASSDDRTAYLRLFVVMFLPVIHATLITRWRSAARHEDLQGALRLITDATLKSTSQRASGFAAYLEELVASTAARAEENAEHLAPAVDHDAQHTAFDTAWARTMIREASNIHRARAVEPTQRFRAELLRLHLEEGMPFNSIASRWSIDPKALAHEYGEARSEVLDIVTEFVRFFGPEQSRLELHAEAKRLLATAGSASPSS